jgi:SAM-dependent methyltransferase
MPSSYANPPPQLLRTQAEWLAPARARLLRRAAIAHRRQVLDLGAGSGAVTGELARRCGGVVTAVDLDLAALRSGSEPARGDASAPILHTCANALHLPFAAAAFDLVFCQCVLMWVAGVRGDLGDRGDRGDRGDAGDRGSRATQQGRGDREPDGALQRVAREIARVLEPGGVFIAIEPDYGGLIEHPPAIATRDLWLAGLARAGADPCVGRRLPGVLESAGLSVQVDLLPHLLPPAAARFDLLRGLPLTPVEKRRLDAAAAADGALVSRGGWGRVGHLPFFLVTATRPPSIPLAPNPQSW